MDVFYFCPAAAAVCQGGYGSYVSAELSITHQPSCRSCAADTYGPKGSTSPCSLCPAGTISKPGSNSQDDCYEAWVKLNKDFDYIPMVNTQSLTQLPGTFNTEESCRDECSKGNGDRSCVFYQWNFLSRSCAVYYAPTPAAGGAGVAGAVQIGVRVDVGVYSVYAANEASYSIGKALAMNSFQGSNNPADAGSIAAASVADCTRRCDQTEACFAVLVTKALSGKGFQCSLRGGDVSAEVKSQYRAVGSNIDAWFS